MKELDELRNEINLIDSEIIRLLNERLYVVIKIKELKKNLSIPITNLIREQEIINNFQLDNLDMKFVKDLYEVIFEYSKQKQSE